MPAVRRSTKSTSFTRSGTPYKREPVVSASDHDNLMQQHKYCFRMYREIITLAHAESNRRLERTNHIQTENQDAVDQLASTIERQSELLTSFAETIDRLKTEIAAKTDQLYDIRGEGIFLLGYCNRTAEDFADRPCMHHLSLLNN